MNDQPIVLVEDDQHQVSVAQQLERHLGVPVILLSRYHDLTSEVARLAEDPALRKPVVILDAGLPDICRFDTVRTAVNDVGRRASILQWTAAKTVATHTGALIEGARASLAKTHSAATLATVVKRVASDRLWCEPDQAQWFLELLACVYEHHEGTRDSIWHWGEIANLPDAEWYEHTTTRLTEIAQGGELEANDSWFAALLAEAKSWWLSPRQRQVRIALLVHPTRASAAVTLGIEKGTIASHAARVSGRLMPHKFLQSTPKAEKDAHTLTRLLVEMHIPCELTDEEHLWALTNPEVKLVEAESGIGPGDAQPAGEPDDPDGVAGLVSDTP